MKSRKGEEEREEEREKRIKLSRKEHMSKVGEEVYQYMYESKRVQGLSWSLAVKTLPANAGDAGLIPALGRSPEEGNGNPR